MRGIRIQQDLAAMLAADEQLHHVQVIAEGQRGEAGSMLFENQVNQALAGQTPVNGKTGLALLVFLPEGKPASRANSGLVTDYELIVRAVENIAVNEDPEHGTGISCETMLMEVMKLLQMWHPLRGHPLTVAEFYPQPLKDQDHLRAWECVVTFSDAEAARPKCAKPLLTEGDILITMDCATEGAAIHYTLDGTLPTPANGFLYAAPVDIEGPATVRAMAYAAEHRPSDCAEITL